MEMRDTDLWRPAPYALKAGAIIFHGTNRDFDEASLRRQSWLSHSRKVAEHFATWKMDDGVPRVATYRTDCDLTLCLIRGKADLLNLEEYFGVVTSDAESMAETFSRYVDGFDGWIIPKNYPDGGDDIMLIRTDRLIHLKTENLPR